MCMKKTYTSMNNSQNLMHDHLLLAVPIISVHMIPNDDQHQVVKNDPVLGSVFWAWTGIRIACRYIGPIVIFKAWFKALVWQLLFETCSLNLSLVIICDLNIWPIFVPWVSKEELFDLAPISKIFFYTERLADINSVNCKL